MNQNFTYQSRKQMNTVMKLNNSIFINEENMLIRPDGTYNQDIHSKLSKIIHNIALKCVRTNTTINVDDLKQNAWLKIYEAIRKGNEKGIYREINYLVIVAKNSILADCMNVSHDRENIDDFSSMLMSSYDQGNSKGGAELNVAKAKLEYDISKHKPDEAKATDLRVSLEQLLEELDDERVKTFIILKYVKDCNGTSPKILNMYNNFVSTLDNERREILTGMDKFTNNAAFRVMGIRATDNCTTNIRHKIKDVLYDLYCYI